MPAARDVADRGDGFHVTATIVTARDGPPRRITARACALDRVVGPVWLGRALLLSALFVLMSICHGAVMPERAIAASAQEHLPIHAVDCAVDVEAAAPFPTTAKVFASVHLAVDGTATAIAVPAVSWTPDDFPVDPPAERRARLQIFLI